MYCCLGTTLQPSTYGHSATTRRIFTYVSSATTRRLSTHDHAGPPRTATRHGTIALFTMFATLVPSLHLQLEALMPILIFHSKVVLPRVRLLPFGTLMPQPSSSHSP